MNKNQIDDIMFEAILRQAVIDDYADEIDSIPPNEELAVLYPLSSSFELRMKKLFTHERRKGFYRATLICPYGSDRCYGVGFNFI